MSPFLPQGDTVRRLGIVPSLECKVERVEDPAEDGESRAPEDPINKLDVLLREQFTLLYMLEPGNHLNSKLGVQSLYRKDLLTAFFHKEPLTALYSHKLFQAISLAYGAYLVITAYLSTLKYHNRGHRLVKVDTVLIDSPYQRSPTLIDFSLASCSWNENLHFVLLVVQGLSYMLASLFAFYECMKAPKRVKLACSMALRADFAVRVRFRSSFSLAA
eukprot:767897-Hanusia_phi.AAC.7